MDLKNWPHLISTSVALFSIAYRMLGSVADAEDMVQGPLSDGCRLLLKKSNRRGHFWSPSLVGSALTTSNRLAFSASNI